MSLFLIRNMSLNKVMTLAPVWRITTDTGAYQLNLINGALERLT